MCLHTADREKFTFHVHISVELQQIKGQCVFHVTMRRAHITIVAV